MLPFLSSMPTKHLVNTLLPEPDSPTMARVSPSYRSKEVRRMATSFLPRREKVTSTSRAERMGSWARIFLARSSKSMVLSLLVISLMFRALLYTWFRGSQASENALPTR